MMNDVKPRRYPSAACALLALAGLGCIEQPERYRLNAPPQGEAVRYHPLTETFGYQNDQGMIADMAIADLHFVPHTADLSGGGEARLERYGELLATTGGTIYYDTRLNDEEMIQARIDAAEAFLACFVPAAQPIEIVRGLPGGRGMDAAEMQNGHNIAKQAEPRSRAYRLRPTVAGG